jgi:hypothetical protein
MQPMHIIIAVVFIFDSSWNAKGVRSAYTAPDPSERFSTLVTRMQSQQIAAVP